MTTKTTTNQAPASAGAKAAADVAALLRARNPLLWITTREEARAEAGIVQAAEAASYEPRFWDCATGVSDFAGKPQDPGARQVAAGVHSHDGGQHWHEGH